jgi:transposase
MTIVLGLDQHRAQITFDEADDESGELSRGQIRPATRDRLRAWLVRYQGKQVRAALEATTGWLFLAEELARIGAEVHLADPAEVRARSGRKRRAKTDRRDARHLRELLAHDQLAPEAWIPPGHIQELRTLVRLRKTLVDERRAWQQRIQATLFHHGYAREPQPRSPAGRARLGALALPPAARTRVEVALRTIEHLSAEIAPLEAELRTFARHQPGCRALMREHGIAERSACAILEELGDVRRFRSSRRAVRHGGLDVTVFQSDSRRPPGRLSRQGPPVLRWALFEAAKCARQPSSPHHRYWQQARARVGATAATVAVSRRLLRRCYHRLLALGEEALAPAA